MKLSESLIEAKERISNINHWCQFSAAKDDIASFASVDVSDSSATCWCAFGSVLKTVDSHNMSATRTDEMMNILDDVASRVFHKCGIIDLNDKGKYDEETHLKVLKTFDIAIEIARAKEI